MEEEVEWWEYGVCKNRKRKRKHNGKNDIDQ